MDYDYSEGREVLLHVYRTYGISATLSHIVDMELADPRSNGTIGKSSKIALTPEQARNSLLLSLCDIPERIWEGFLTGSLLSDHMKIITPESLEAQISQLSSNSDSSPSRPTSPGKSIIVDILQSAEAHGELKFECQWENPDEVTWEPAQIIVEDSPLIVADFYRRHPGADRCYLDSSEEWGPMQKLIEPIPRKIDNEINGYQIYAHYFVDCNSSNNAFKSPTTRELLHLVQRMEYYCSNPTESAAKKAHQEYCAAVDNQPAYQAFGNWSPALNEQGYRKHLATSKTEPQSVMDRLRDMKKLLFPSLRHDLMKIPEDRLDEPYPYPWTEVGYTAHPWARRKAHASHGGTTAGLALVEEIATLEFPQRKLQWRYVTLAQCRVDSDRYNMELLFSRALRSYFWLGGFNSTIAAFATPSGSDIPGDDGVLISSVDGLRNLSAMNFAQAKINIAADKQKLDTFILQRQLRQRLENAQNDSAQIFPKIEKLKERLSALEINLEALQKEAKDKMVDELTGMIEGVDTVLEKLEEVERLQELADVTDQLVQALRTRKAESDRSQGQGESSS